MSKVHSEEEYESKFDTLTTLRLYPPVVSTVLPLQRSATLAANYRQPGPESKKGGRRLSNLQLPFTSPYKMPSFVTKQEGPGIIFDGDDDVKDIVKDALDSLSFENLLSEVPETISPRRRPSLSHRERSIRLVRHCSSWTLLDDTKENKTYYDSQGKIRL